MTMHHLESVPYTYAKGGCYLCLRDVNCVDLGTVIEGEGGLALCDRCVTDAAHVLGILPRPRVRAAAE